MTDPDAREMATDAATDWATDLPFAWISLPDADTLPLVLYLARLLGRTGDNAPLTVTLPERLHMLLGPTRLLLAGAHLPGGEIDIETDATPDHRARLRFRRGGETAFLTLGLAGAQFAPAIDGAHLFSLDATRWLATPHPAAAGALETVFDPAENLLREVFRDRLREADAAFAARRDLQTARRTLEAGRRTTLDLRDLSAKLQRKRDEYSALARALSIRMQELADITAERDALARSLAEAAAARDALAARFAALRPGLVYRICRRLFFRPQQLPLPATTPHVPDAPSGEASGSVPAEAPVARRILFVAGEPETPGMAYRCTRLADAARAAGYEARVMPCAAIGGDDVMWADILHLWRVEFSGHVDILIRLAKEKNATLIFDADDLVFIPHLARTDIIDGIRSIGATEDRIERTFADMRRTMLRCDLGFATTLELADAMRVMLTHTELVPNSYDSASLARARLARRRWTAEQDGLIRIGYATGSRTHQRDFALISPIVAELLLSRPALRLVLFQEAGNKRPVLLMEEFPELAPVAAQIEWRDMVPLDRLPDEFARFDISIAPLETGNVFCEAKSEIKYIEPALAGAACIASPTAPFRRVVRHGVTGLLAGTRDEWRAALLALIDDPERRRIMARDAYHDVLWPFGPQAQAHRLRRILDGIGPDREIQAALSAETALARAAHRPRDLPVIPASTTLFHQDRFDAARVTVVVTLYNYAAYILDALDSVRDQTLDTLDLIVVDDGSTDESVPLARLWMERHADRFNRLILLRTAENVGLGGARNVGMDAAETPFVMQLDADNRLRPEACARLLDAMADDQTGYAYPILHMIGADGPLMGKATSDDPDGATKPALLGDIPFAPARLLGGNHVDAMAMLAKWAWAAAGGYYVARDAMGWEDYDLWCSLAELGITGRHVPEILADYRTHHDSMTNSLTERARHKARVVEHVMQRHPWIRLVATEARQRT
ncbi:glycosyltransferase [Acidomonas methanolica]|uniref:glycosyltransferase n=1 Tax=Acidomonas methanolica TaxID=437 RepID=UPI002119C77C|nr:glycosyltransferase [Acidomonas methanolica]